MVFESVTRPLQTGTESQAAFVCPLCGTTFQHARQFCSRCDGNLVVPIDDSEVYETIVPMCGPDCRPKQLPDGGQ